MAIEKQLALCVSPAIFEEYQEVLAREKFKKLEQKSVKRFLSVLKQRSLWIEPRVTVDVIKNDPADNKFLECALAVQADFLITGNVRHFPPKAFHETRIVTPREFIAFIAELLTE
jgi:putative PIN family toxin of toxin-antitoxin system